MIPYCICIKRNCVRIYVSQCSVIRIIEAEDVMDVSIASAYVEAFVLHVVMAVGVWY